MSHIMIHLESAVELLARDPLLPTAISTTRKLFLMFT